LDDNKIVLDLLLPAVFICVESGNVLRFISNTLEDIKELTVKCLQKPKQMFDDANFYQQNHIGTFESLSSVLGAYCTKHEGAKNPIWEEDW
jgi:hypothetical protein